MIAIVDFGLGNLRSVLYKIQKLGFDAKILSDPEEITQAEKLILPGVGSAKAGMDNLHARDLVQPLTEMVIRDKIPVFGICLGVQLFTQKSEEGNIPCLGWIDGETHRFRMPENTCKVPHVGWNTLTFKKKSALLRNISEDIEVYFTHSYHVCCHNPEDILTTTEYGYEFVSSLERGNIYGTQFHPEKSRKAGMIFLKNFLEVE